MKKRVLSFIKYLAFLLLGFFLLWLVFRKIDLNEVVDQFRQAKYGWILLSFVFAVLSHIARAIRWNILINSLGYSTRTSTTFYAVMIGYFVNMAVPRLGELSRCGVLSQKDKIPVNSLFGSVVSERVFDLVILVLLILSVVVFQFDLVGGFLEKHIFTPVYLRFADNMNTIVFIFFAFVFLIVLFIVLLRLFLPRLKKLSSYQKFNEFVLGFLDGIKTIWKLKKKLWFLFWTIVIWFNYLMMSYVVFFALSATSHLTFEDAITVLAIGSLGMVAPVPGGIGAYHFFVTLIFFELFGLQKVYAASWATLMHASQGVLILVVGAFSYLMIFLQKRKDQNGIPGNSTIQNLQ